MRVIWSTMVCLLLFGGAQAATYSVLRNPVPLISDVAFEDIKAARSFPFLIYATFPPLWEPEKAKGLFDEFDRVTKTEAQVDAALFTPAALLFDFKSRNVDYTRMIARKAAVSQRASREPPIYKVVAPPAVITLATIFCLPLLKRSGPQRRSARRYARFEAGSACRNREQTRRAFALDG
jgi:hypothetical protein